MFQEGLDYSCRPKLGWDELSVCDDLLEIDVTTLHILSTQSRRASRKYMRLKADLSDREDKEELRTSISRW